MTPAERLRAEFISVARRNLIARRVTACRRRAFLRDLENAPSMEIFRYFAVMLLQATVDHAVAGAERQARRRTGKPRPKAPKSADVTRVLALVASTGVAAAVSEVERSRAARHRRSLSDAERGDLARDLMLIARDGRYVGRESVLIWLRKK